jgi:hypothetical protein
VQIIWIGAMLALVAYLVGPGRAPRWLRRQAARAARSTGRATGRAGHLAAAHGPAWIARYLDPVRIAGLIVAVVAALLLSSWTALLVVAVVLAVYEIGVTLIARSVTDQPPPGAASTGDLTTA